jgi:SAM-dependent methyltransferase
MFTKTADFYDALYHFKDYKAACDEIINFIQGHNHKAATLLDVGCGSGKHLSYLQSAYRVEGLDLNGELLEIARKRCPDVPFHQEDMTSFQLTHTFDVVACFFSSIGYVATVENLNKSIAIMAKHLNPGGLLLIEPWITREKYWKGKLIANFTNLPELKISWMYIQEMEDNKSIFDINYMVGTVEGINTFNEQHVMGLWTDEQYQQAFEKAGIKPHFNEKGFFGRGLYYGVKA